MKLRANNGSAKRLDQAMSRGSVRTPRHNSAGMTACGIGHST
jgi:hypothetical protein